jgi:hypothetical protein
MSALNGSSATLRRATTALARYRSAAVLVKGKTMCIPCSGYGR